MVERTWCGEQYAYRRDRAVELNLAVLHTEIQENLDQERSAHLASLDINAAFDEVPSNLLGSTLGRALGRGGRASAAARGDAA